MSNVDGNGAGARPVAWVTGASRGMGADIAVQFARAGYDVAITARDEQRLRGVAGEIEAAGGRALVHPSDLTDRPSVVGFAEAALAEFGRCDVVVNNGVYQAPGAFQLIMDTDPDEMILSYEADVVAATVLAQRAIAAMLEHGGGTVVNMSSSSVFLEPQGTVKDNGWSFGYVAAKAGIDQMASLINVELGDRGIRAFNVEPGFVAYGERFRTVLEKYPGRPVSPPESIGPAIVWLVESPEADRLLRKRVSLPDLTHRRGLLPGWNGPGSDFASTRSY
jgi:NAD(P)-dependent dehydrogenase (short-subunit alcohol dehydrogenase family)